MMSGIGCSRPRRGLLGCMLELGEGVWVWLWMRMKMCGNRSLDQP